MSDDGAMRSEHSLLTSGIVDAVKRGDVERFSELYARVSPALRVWAELRMPKWILRRVSPEDLVQEVWVRALVRFVDFDPERAPFRPWILGFGRMVLTELLRQNVTEDAANDPSPLSNLDHLPDAMTTLVRRVARRGTGEAVVRQIRELDEEERRLLLLRAFDGGSHESIAREFGISPAAARKKWQRLRERLEALGVAEHLIDET